MFRLTTVNWVKPFCLSAKVLTDRQTGRQREMRKHVYTALCTATCGKNYLVIRKQWRIKLWLFFLTDHTMFTSHRFYISVLSYRKACRRNFFWVGGTIKQTTNFKLRLYRKKILVVPQNKYIFGKSELFISVKCKMVQFGAIWVLKIPTDFGSFEEKLDVLMPALCLAISPTFSAATAAASVNTESPAAASSTFTEMINETTLWVEKV